MFVGDGTHHAAHSQAVEVVVDEDQAAQDHRGQLGTHPGPNVGLSPPAKGGRASRPVHQADHGPQDHQEDQDAHVVGIGHRGDNSLQENMAHGPLKAKVGIEQAAGYDTNEQGRVDLLGNQRQGNGNDRGQQRPDGVVEMAGGFYIPRSLAGGAQEGAAAGLAGLVLTIAGHAQAGGAAVAALDHLAARLLRRVPGSHGSGAHRKQQHHRHCQQSQQTTWILSHGVLSFSQKKS